ESVGRDGSGCWRYIGRAVGNGRRLSSPTACGRVRSVRHAGKTPRVPSYTCVAVLSAGVDGVAIKREPWTTCSIRSPFVAHGCGKVPRWSPWQHPEDLPTWELPSGKSCSAAVSCDLLGLFSGWDWTPCNLRHVRGPTL